MEYERGGSPLRDRRQSDDSTSDNEANTEFGLRQVRRKTHIGPLPRENDGAIVNRPPHLRSPAKSRRTVKQPNRGKKMLSRAQQIRLDRLISSVDETESTFVSNVQVSNSPSTSLSGRESRPVRASSPRFVSSSPNKGTTSVASSSDHAVLAKGCVNSDATIPVKRVKKMLTAARQNKAQEVPASLEHEQKGLANVALGTNASLPSPVQSNASAAVRSSSLHDDPTAPSILDPTPGVVDVPQELPTENFGKISALNPGVCQTPLRVQVLSAPKLTAWEKPAGSGRLSSVDVRDEEMDIRLLCYNNAIECSAPYLKPEAILEINNFKCRKANPQYLSTKSAHEIVLDHASIVQECLNGSVTYFTSAESFVSVKVCCDMQAFQLVSLCAMVSGTSEVFHLTRKKDGKPLRKRLIRLEDQSEASILLTVWNADCDKFEGALRKPVRIIRARTEPQFGRIALTLTDASNVSINPPLCEASLLSKWWATQPPRSPILLPQSLPQDSALMTFSAVFEHLKTQASNSRITFWNRVNIEFIKSEDMFYKGCQNRSCRKRVKADLSGKYLCENCKTSSSAFVWHYLLRTQMRDSTVTVSVTAFDAVSST